MILALGRLYERDDKIPDPKPRRGYHDRDNGPDKTVRDPASAQWPAAKIFKELSYLPDIPTAIQQKSNDHDSGPHDDRNDRQTYRTVILRFAFYHPNRSIYRPPSPNRSPSLPILRPVPFRL